VSLAQVVPLGTVGIVTEVPASAGPPDVPFPVQPRDVPWPTQAWPQGAPDPDVDAATVDDVVAGLLAPGADPPAGRGVTLAVAVAHRGRLVAEGYGVQPDSAFGPGGPVDADTPLVSWSMAKSITHAAVGLLVGDGLVRLHDPAPVPEWAGTDKAGITLQHLLEMRPGLRFVEDYVDGSISHCLEMLFGSGASDHAAYAAALPLDHPPGTVWNYSSGTTNIVARIIGDRVAQATGRGGAEGVRAFLHDRLFAPIGMASADPRFDGAGTWVGSSYVYATARDFARFGTLYLRNGEWDGRRLLPEGWADHARTWTATDPESGFGYGAHWWLWPDQPGSLAAHGYEGQYTVVLPAKDLVVVHLGKWPAELRPVLVAELRRLIGAFPEARAP
jgi:CubicO group peptidase (beta-lactamase class C family)